MLLSIGLSNSSSKIKYGFLFVQDDTELYYLFWYTIIKITVKGKISKWKEKSRKTSKNTQKCSATLTWILTTEESVAWGQYSVRTYRQEHCWQRCSARNSNKYEWLAVTRTSNGTSKNTSKLSTPYCDFNHHKNAHVEFTTKFLDNPLGFLCSISDKLGWKIIWRHFLLDIMKFYKFISRIGQVWE